MPKRFSKNSKKGWKQIDMSTVQSEISQTRNEEIQKESLQQLANEQLFTIDKKKNKVTLKDKKIKNKEKLLDTTPDRAKIDFTKPIQKQKPTRKDKILIIQHKEEVEKVVKPMQKPKTPEGVYDLWGADESKKNKKVSHRKPKMLSKIPHSGQSYNPDENERQQALKIIHDKEMRRDKKTNQFITMLNRGESTNKDSKRNQEENKDVDVVAQKEEEEGDFETIKRKKREKLSLKKKHGINRFKQEFERHKERKRNREEPSIEEIQKDLSTIADHQKKLLRLKKKKLEKKNQPDLPLRSVNDVLLTGEIPKGLRQLEGNSYDLWMDGLKNLKDSDLFEDIHLNKIKHTYLQPGFPIKEKK